MIKLGLVGIGLGAASLLLAGFAGSAGAQTGVWHQSYERADEAAECVAPADETPWQESFGGQREWTPSWAQWANGGNGGWVCQRAIVWAQIQTYPSAGCVPYAAGTYVNFNGGYALPADSPVYGFADCTGYVGTDVLAPGVYAPAGFDANQLCQEAFGLPNASRTAVDNIFQCGV